MKIIYPAKQQDVIKMHVNLIPILSRIVGKINGKIMQATALVENIRLN